MLRYVPLSVLMLNIRTLRPAAILLLLLKISKIKVAYINVFSNDITVYFDIPPSDLQLPFIFLIIGN